MNEKCETDEQLVVGTEEIEICTGYSSPCASPVKSPLMDKQNHQDKSPNRSSHVDEPMCSSDEAESTKNDHPHLVSSNSMPCSPTRQLPDVEQESSSTSKNQASQQTAAIANRFPFNIRDTVDWIIGRSRRKNEVNKENRNNTTGANQPVSSTAKKTGVVSASHSSSAKARRATASENCVADSIDENMIGKLTEIPAGVDRNEWLATHTLDLFENISALCGTVYDHCTPATCACMSFPGQLKASWTDEKGKRHQYSAGRYIDCVMSFCEAARRETIFPTKYGMPFPADFEQQCRRIIRLLWHCCGHLYTKHWDLLALLNLRPQYGLVLAHLAAIAKIFVLLDSKEFNSLTNTLSLVRPSCLQAPPAKRMNEQMSFSDSTATVNQTTNSANWMRVMSKSGSWGGQSQSSSIASSTMATMPALTNNNNKNALIHNSQFAAQTC